MADPAHQPQPDLKKRPRDTDAAKGASSAPEPDELRDTELDDAQAAKALEKIEEVRQKLEPLG